MDTKKRIHPAIMIVAIAAALVLVALYGYYWLGPKPTAIGFKNGRPMTEEEGRAMGAAMSGGRSNGSTTPTPGAGQTNK